MRHIFLLLLLLPLVARAAVDNIPDPDKHWLYVGAVLDDRGDTTIVNVCREYNMPLMIAPYRLGGTQMIDIDSTDFDGDGSATKGEYAEFSLKWAAARGVKFANHDSAVSTAVVAAGGRDSMVTRWNAEHRWLRSLLPSYAKDIDCYVWTGHVNSPELRVMAKRQGYGWTRGDIGYSRDLYLSAKGWELESGARSFLPPCMTHRSLVPSFSLYRLNSSGSVPQDTTAAGIPAVSDSAGWWDGVYDAFMEGRKSNQLWVLNPHPGWNIPFAETEADTISEQWCHMPDGDSLRFATRRGAFGRNDVSGFQWSIILHRLKNIDDSLYAADGIRRICFVDMSDFINNPLANFRSDDSSDPDLVSDWTPAGGATSEPQWTSNNGLYAKDPALNRNHVIYVDGTGERTAGNGTLAHPLPHTALDHLFNCKVIFTGHSAGDSLEYDELTWRTGNVDVDFAGLTLLPATAGQEMFVLDTLSTNYYLHNITLRNFTMDQKATSASTPGIYFGPALETADSLRLSGATLKGVTCINGESAVYVYSSEDATIDSCFFKLGEGAIEDNSSTFAIRVGAESSNTLIRNSLFDYSDVGGNTGSASGVAIYLVGHTPDSLRVLNNSFALGSAAQPTDIHKVLRVPADNSQLKLRFAGNYIANGSTNGDKEDVVWFNTPGAAGTLEDFMDTLGVYESAFASTKNFEASFAAETFDYLEDASDTTRLAGYTGIGSKQTGAHASIGPALTTDYPRVRVNSVSRSGIDENVQLTLYHAASLIDKGMLAPADSNDISTWFPVSVPRTDGERAQWEYLLSQYEAFPDSTKQRLKLVVKD